MPAFRGPSGILPTIDDPVVASEAVAMSVLGIVDVQVAVKWPEPTGSSLGRAVASVEALFGESLLLRLLVTDGVKASLLAAVVPLLS